MSIIAILKESMGIAKKNPMIFVPMLALTVIVSLLSFLILGTMFPSLGALATTETVSYQELIGAAGAAIGSLFFVLIISSILGFLAHGMTVIMAGDAVKQEPVTLKGGFAKVLARIIPLLIAAVLVGIIVSIGTVLLILPGLIAAIFLMFTFIAVMIDNENPFKAIGKSVKTVAGHFGTVFVLVLVLIGLGVLFFLVNLVVGMIPLLGAVLAIVLSAVYTGYVSVFLVLAYQSLQDKSPEESPEPQA